jgi:hypothetical protein
MLGRPEETFNAVAVPELGFLCGSVVWQMGMGVGTGSSSDRCVLSGVGGLGAYAMRWSNTSSRRIELKTGITGKIEEWRLLFFRNQKDGPVDLPLSGIARTMDDGDGSGRERFYSRVVIIVFEQWTKKSNAHRTIEKKARLLPLKIKARLQQSKIKAKKASPSKREQARKC